MRTYLKNNLKKKGLGGVAQVVEQMWVPKFKFQNKEKEENILTF
jgi:hypothetical protein